MFCSGEREAVELINSGVQKLNKDSEPISLVSIQSPGKLFLSYFFKDVCESDYKIDTVIIVWQ